ncbi:Hypothetical predicted protein [Mytilus galloprovincialis]|uniref:Reverse transcriptase domain-containing protein n=1 Tax=Mytilus galloprovincialis TaxID=29158 RepID=A0A8B6E4R2_MYTGA|nr:Hypothetical predicted protein [Mytilus galloprovincialis]
MIRNGLHYDSESQKWEASYPWKRSPSELPNNVNSAKAKLLSTEKRLHKMGQEYSESYQNQIEDMVKRNVARKLTETEIQQYEGPVHYVHHHEVLKPESKSTPIRIVFNSSASYMGHILNEYWAKGPNVINDLLGVLLRFRQEKVATAGDISKMYNSVNLSLLDQHTHRFVWRDMDSSKLPDHYVLQTVTFGDKPSGAIATIALQMTADMCSHTYPDTAKMINKNSYVDDILVSKETMNVIQICDNILRKGGFAIKHWIVSGDSNDDMEGLNVVSTMLKVNCIFNAVQKDVYSIPNQYIWEENSAEKFQNALASPLVQEKIKTFNNTNYTGDSNIMIQDLNNILYEAANISIKKKIIKKVNSTAKVKKSQQSKWFDLPLINMKKQLCDKEKLLKKYNKDPYIRSSYFALLKKYRKARKTKYREFRADLIDQLDNLREENPKSDWTLLASLKNSDKETEKSSNITSTEWAEYFKDLNKKTVNSKVLRPMGLPDIRIVSTSKVWNEKTLATTYTVQFEAPDDVTFDADEFPTNVVKENSGNVFAVSIDVPVNRNDLSPRIIARIVVNGLDSIPDGTHPANIDKQYTDKYFNETETTSSYDENYKNVETATINLSTMDADNVELAEFEFNMLALTHRADTLIGLIRLQWGEDL